MLEAPPRGEDASAGPVIVPRAMLKTVIAPRVEETLELLRDRLKASGLGLEPGAGLVLTGGASQLNGVRELAVRVFDRPVRLGRPQRAPHLADAASGSGLLLGRRRSAARRLRSARSGFGPQADVASAQPPPTRPASTPAALSPAPQAGCAKISDHARPSCFPPELRPTVAGLWRDCNITDASSP